MFKFIARIFWWFVERKDDVKAWTRGERRIASGRRGRCFEKKNPIDNNGKPGNAIQAEAHGHGTLAIRVIRKNGDIEDHGVVPLQMRAE